MGTMRVNDRAVLDALLAMMRDSTVVGFNSDSQPMILWYAGSYGWLAAWFDPEVKRVVNGSLDDLTLPMLLLSVDPAEPTFVIQPGEDEQ